MDMKFHCQSITITVNGPENRITVVVQDALVHPRDIAASTVPKELQERINRCHSLKELYTLLFATEDDSEGVITAFAKRRLQIEGHLPFEDAHDTAA
jgi:hypothetical protein